MTVTTVESDDRAAAVARLVGDLPHVRYEDHGVLQVDTRQMIATGELEEHIVRADPMVWAAVPNLCAWREVRIEAGVVTIRAANRAVVYKAVGYCPERDLLLLAWPD